MPRVRRGPTELATRRDLQAAGHDLRKLPALATSALGLARVLDGNSPLTARDVATVAAEFRQTLAELARKAPARPQEDSLAKRRARRVARGAAG